MFKFLMDCRGAQERQSRILDGDASLRDRFLVSIHCAMCAYCRRFGKQIGLLRGYLKNLPSGGAEAILSDEARSRIKKHLEDEKKS